MCFFPGKFYLLYIKDISWWIVRQISFFTVGRSKKQKFEKHCIQIRPRSCSTLWGCSMEQCSRKHVHQPTVRGVSLWGGERRSQLRESVTNTLLDLYLWVLDRLPNFPGLAPPQEYFSYSIRILTSNSIFNLWKGELLICICKKYNS